MTTIGSHRLLKRLATKKMPWFAEKNGLRRRFAGRRTRVGELAGGTVRAAVAWLIHGALLNGRKVTRAEAETVLRQVLRAPG